LDEAVKEEDYDTALEIQEEIRRRKKKLTKRDYLY
jgi:protein-arginine kinase activator protein McsA